MVTVTELPPGHGLWRSGKQRQALQRGSWGGARRNNELRLVAHRIHCAVCDRALLCQSEDDQIDAELALSGGEDYELLFTASAEIMDKVKNLASCPVTVIGEVVADNVGEVILIDREGRSLDWQDRGWEHLSIR